MGKCKCLTKEGGKEESAGVCGCIRDAVVQSCKTQLRAAAKSGFS